ncbi:hypothetical protein [Streptomyces ipomoeae]|uniref:hypothetical protein n=1 Tax=Streptomyces ipomoeae TaxID=103232 RepID=UPI0029A73C19|nr:hypothetical protein [Streptomyces ipomoeae]MDX2692944.1 hypothetical protein [Streptomyces ipomoeae]MDX2840676.1 hypothetical protein [Streptomyces ipomoeae]
MVDTKAAPPVERDGVIKDRSWGRDRGKPIWWFQVLFDGDTEARVYHPSSIHAGVEAARKTSSDE